MPKNIGEILKELRDSKGWNTPKLEMKSGVNQNTIRAIENRGISKPEFETVTKLAKAFGAEGDILFKTAGYPKPPAKPVEELSQEDLLDRAKLAAPARIPVYSEFHAGDEHAEPTEYFYLPRSMAAGKSIEAYIVHGHCLSPKVENNDVVIVDRTLTPEPGDILLCLSDRELVCGRYEQKNGEACIRNTNETINLTDCQITAVIIEVVKRLR